jgi:hypothetical protein
LFMLESEGMQRFVHGNARLIPTHEWQIYGIGWLNSAHIAEATTDGKQKNSNANLKFA